MVELVYDFLSLMTFDPKREKFEELRDRPQPPFPQTISVVDFVTHEQRDTLHKARAWSVHGPYTPSRTCYCDPQIMDEKNMYRKNTKDNDMKGE